MKKIALLLPLFFLSATAHAISLKCVTENKLVLIDVSDEDSESNTTVANISINKIKNGQLGTDSKDISSAEVKVTVNRWAKGISFESVEGEKNSIYYITSAFDGAELTMTVNGKNYSDFYYNCVQ